MAMTRAWLRFISKDDVLPKGAVVESLARRDVSTYPFDFKAPPGPGILFFDEITQEVYDFLREVSRNGIERVLVIAVSHSTLSRDNAWHLLHAGASDVFAWDQVADPAAEVAARFERWDAVDQLVESPLVQNNLIGKSPIWKSILRQVIEVARFTDVSALIIGESGTGKELIARLIHTLDQRPKKGDLVVLDCTTIVPELSGSEFFGHERGAFTGAIAPREGAFALAKGGTLFLDEVGELPLGLQAQLLRVVQERMYKRVGGNTWQHTDFRLVCATNKDLLQEVRQGRFRHDLYYRIAGFTCKLPPLRERTEDILPLVYHFMRELRSVEEPPKLDESVREYLLRREYPGNVRDLKQLCTQISYRCVGDYITAGCTPKEERPWVEPEISKWQDENFERSVRRALSLGVGLKEIGRAAEETAIRIAIEENGNLQHAARKLGVTDRALQMRRAARRTRDAKDEDSIS